MCVEEGDIETHASVITIHRKETLKMVERWNFKFSNNFFRSDWAYRLADSLQFIFPYGFCFYNFCYEISHRYLLKRYKEPIIFPTFLAMDRTYKLHLSSGVYLNPNRHSSPEASLSGQQLGKIQGLLADDWTLLVFFYTLISTFPIS